MAVSTTGTSWLVEYLDPIVENLLITMKRTDADEDLLSSVYEALKGIVEHTSEDSYAVIGKIAPILIEHHLLIEQKLEQFSVSSYLLSTLEAILQKMPDDDANELSHLIMPSLLQIFIKRVCNSNVITMTFYTIATHHIEVLQPFLISQLNNPKKYQICTAAIQLIHCLCKNIGEKVICFSGDLIPILLKHLQNECVGQRLKESILMVIGEITITIGPQLKNQVEIIVTLMTVQSKMDTLYMTTNRLLALNDVHGKFLTAYGGVLSGFKGDEVTINYITQLLDPHLNRMIQVAVGLTEMKSENEYFEEFVISKSIQFLYNFMNNFDRSILSLVDKKAIKKLLVKGSQSEKEKTKRKAILTMEILISLKRQALKESCDQN